jgi:hypothetical protein
MIDTTDILDCIRQYTTPDTRATKRMIATALHLPYANTHSNAVDRMIRDAVTELRKQGHPICSDSGAAGYWYSPSGIGHTIAEYESRANEMYAVARAMKRGRVLSRPQQMELV